MFSITLPVSENFLPASDLKTFQLVRVKTVLLISIPMKGANQSTTRLLTEQMEIQKVEQVIKAFNY
ncbi:CLUMA_CG019264, isoform A [Clunio marinus]|uniref:CLUMA_CG019112, isoform A n=1 Tax=Clunio marinus TaxID=568069 RepID=A0A1J1J503_9DIPT|nr:CLUMA_CG019112, isoform A [Clunio marinus]CRL05961.1 CLUMA_CG019264, isoform A [Clunio marinus]